MVFTGTPTLGWLQRVITQRGYADRLAVIEGATPTEDREYIRSQFTADPTEEPVRVLLATDTAGEGIDLQNHCHRLVNFDIPFNPSRLEQRIGRIDRYGQTETPGCFASCPTTNPPPTPPTRISWPASPVKIAQVEVDLGSANQVIGDEIQEHFARRKPVKRRAKGLDGNQVIQKLWPVGSNSTPGSRSWNAATTPHAPICIWNRRICVVWSTPRFGSTISFRWNRSAMPTPTPRCSLMPPLSPSWQDTLRGLARLKPDVLRPITFDPTAAEGRADLVYVHLGHRSCRKRNGLLRRSLWSVDST